MGLFGFAKDMGKSLFNSDDRAAGSIKEHIEANNPGVENLDVVFDDGIVSLSGVCNSHDAFDKCVLMAGNVKGVIDVYTSGLTLKPQPGASVAPAMTAAPVESAADTAAPAAAAQAQVVPADAPTTEYYTIQSGDTLGKIAKHYYGNAGDYPRIFEANREVIEDPDKIYPGQKIRIPMD